MPLSKKRNRQHGNFGLIYPFMALEWLKPVKFDEFKRNLFKRQYQYTQKSDDEIMTEMMKVVAAYEGR